MSTKLTGAAPRRTAPSWRGVDIHILSIGFVQKSELGFLGHGTGRLTHRVPSRSPNTIGAHLALVHRSIPTIFGRHRETCMRQSVSQSVGRSVGPSVRSSARRSFCLYNWLLRLAVCHLFDWCKRECVHVCVCVCVFALCSTAATAPRSAGWNRHRLRQRCL